MLNTFLGGILGEGCRQLQTRLTFDVLLLLIHSRSYAAQVDITRFIPGKINISSQQHVWRYNSLFLTSFFQVITHNSVHMTKIQLRSEGQKRGKNRKYQTAKFPVSETRSDLFICSESGFLHSQWTKQDSTWKTHFSSWLKAVAHHCHHGLWKLNLCKVLHHMCARILCALKTLWLSSVKHKHSAVL